MAVWRAARAPVPRGLGSAREQGRRPRVRGRGGQPRVRHQAGLPKLWAVGWPQKRKGEPLLQASLPFGFPKESRGACLRLKKVSKEISKEKPASLAQALVGLSPPPYLRAGRKGWGRHGRLAGGEAQTYLWGAWALPSKAILVARPPMEAAEPPRPDLTITIHPPGDQVCAGGGAQPHPRQPTSFHNPLLPAGDPRAPWEMDAGVLTWAT